MLKNFIKNEKRSWKSSNKSTAAFSDSLRVPSYLACLGKGAVVMLCPKVKRNIGPSRCLTCEHFGGFRNSGVLCYKAKRWLRYEVARRDL